MSLTLQADPVPLREEADGALRVGRSRVLLELVIHAFEDGATPEGIVESYSTLDLRDVYAVIAYYLNHREDVERYLREREDLAAEVQKKIEGSQRNLTGLRQRIAAFRASRG